MEDMPNFYDFDDDVPNFDDFDDDEENQISAPVVERRCVGILDDDEDLSKKEVKIYWFTKELDLLSKLCYRRPSSKVDVWAFWSEATLSPCSVGGGSITDSATHTPTTNQPIITDIIKSVLLHYGGYFRSGEFLIQFWAPITTETGCVQLVTSHQPFALSYGLHDGLLKYRKHCLQFKINVDGNGEEVEHLGIPGRVFRQKWQECIPNVLHYSIKEYPQLDVALDCHIQAAFRFPVFHTSFQECVGVLEFAATAISDLYWTSESLINNELERAGLKTSFCDYLICGRTLLWNYVPHSNSAEMPRALEEVCKTHNLPLAKSWVPCGHFNGSMDVSYMGQLFHEQMKYLLDDNLGYFYHKDYNVQKGQGIVRSAYLSYKLCFCRDITQFSITEYPSLPLARTFGLTGCFAICLQSTCPENCHYILEFFLNPKNTYGEDPSTFLCPILATMKQHLPSFKLASGEELGKELSIEFIKPRLNQESASFQCQSTSPPSRPGVLQNGQEMMQPHSSNQQIILDVDLVDAEQNNVPVTRSDDARMNQEPVSSQCQSTISPPGLEVSDNGQETTQPHPPDQQQTDEFEVDVINGGRNVTTEQNNIPVSCSHEGRMNEEVATLQWQSTRSPLGLGVLHDGQETLRAHSSIQQPADEVEVDINNGRNVDAEHNITPGSSSNSEHRPFTHEELETHFKKPRKEVARIYGMSDSTFKRRLVEIGLKWPYVRGKQKFKGSTSRQDPPCSDVHMTPFVRPPVKRKKVNDPPSRQDPPSSDLPARTTSVVTPPLEARTMTIKATYRGSTTIKFQLPLTSGMAQLEEEVSNRLKRLNLDVGTYNLTYNDGEDQISIACDEDLQDCMNASNLSGMNTIRMLIEPN